MRKLLILATLLFAAATTGLGATNRFLVLDGVNDAVEMPPIHYGADELYAFTICGWVQPCSTSSPSEQVVCERAIEIPLGGPPPSKETRLNFRLGLSAGGSPFVRFNGAGSQGVNVEANSPRATLPTNTWTHLAGSYDMSTLRLYTNGTIVTSTPSPETPFNGYLSEAWSNAGVNVIGAHEATPTGIQTNLSLFFSGCIDEVQLWDGALSESEIETWMYQQPSGGESNLVAFWSFDVGTPEDASPRENHGAFVGEATTTPMGCVTAATITGLTLEPHPYIWLSTAPAVLYRLEYSTHLLSNNWQKVYPEVLGTGALTNLCHTNAPDSQTFWRVIAH